MPMRSLFRRSAKAPAAIPAGLRAYAVGDVHGRADLLEQLLARIEEDHRSRAPAKGVVIFLGDLIDRGPDSAKVVERLRTYAPDGITPRFLLGNHEEVLLRLLAGERGVLDSWLTFGGAECLKSYGVDSAAIRAMSEEQGLLEIAKAIPAAHQAFLSGFADTARLGDYLFVHAGIRPGLDLSLQSQSDLRWIRAPFLDDDSDHGFVVVHGHTIADQVVEKPNRIGIDTGAYRTGVLTALVLEGADRRYLDTAGADESGEEKTARIALVGTDG